MRDRLVLSERATTFGSNASSSHAARTRRWRPSDTALDPFRKWDTVLVETPVSRATSRAVTIRDAPLMLVGRCAVRVSTSPAVPRPRQVRVLEGAASAPSLGNSCRRLGYPSRKTS